ncbi:MAG TPA: hypothetical protein VFK02_04265 [Kofleriaceae bacterium]|nr:hypothetical protein [Kofleriaceae bacterium]
MVGVELAARDQQRADPHPGAGLLGERAPALPGSTQLFDQDLTDLHHKTLGRGPRIECDVHLELSHFPGSGASYVPRWKIATQRMSPGLREARIAGQRSLHPPRLLYG